MMIVHDSHDVLTLARTLWGEARVEPLERQIAVAWVVRNRAARNRFSQALFGSNGAVAYVCRVPRQFSCWNKEDPNHLKLVALREDQCRTQIGIASSVLDGLVVDPTNGADHYHTIDAPSWAQKWPPNWAPTMRETARFGGHLFYDSMSAPR